MTLHPYQAWLSMGHQDSAKDAEFCGKCGSSYESFTGNQKSCAEVKEEAEALRKKLEESSSTTWRPWKGL